VAKVPLIIDGNDLGTVAVSSTATVRGTVRKFRGATMCFDVIGLEPSTADAVAFDLYVGNVKVIESGLISNCVVNTANLSQQKVRPVPVTVDGGQQFTAVIRNSSGAASSNYLHILHENEYDRPDFRALIANAELLLKYQDNQVAFLSRKNSDLTELTVPTDQGDVVGVEVTVLQAPNPDHPQNAYLTLSANNEEFVSDASVAIWSRTTNRYGQIMPILIPKSSTFGLKLTQVELGTYIFNVRWYFNDFNS
jgi:hypothetical protein